LLRRRSRSEAGYEDRFTGRGGWIILAWPRARVCRRLTKPCKPWLGAIDAVTERQDSGPGVMLTLGGLVVSGTIIPDWQWFRDVEHATRAAFVLQVGGSIHDEHGGWAIRSTST
jgi:hypothetical protein